MTRTRAPTAGVAQPAEQLRYAAWLDMSTRIGLAVLGITFFGYLSGLMEPLVPLTQLPELWVHPVSRYVELTGTPVGWDWIRRLGHGDVAGLLGIALLASCSVPCLLALLPIALERGDRAFAAVCLAEAAVIVLAASGWIGSGH